MTDLTQRNLRLFGPPGVTRRDRRNVRKLGKQPKFARGVEKPADSQGRGSSDEDSVSRLAPLGRFSMACVSKEGVTGHHRDYAAQVKLAFAHRGMLRAAEVLAGAAFDLFADAKRLAQAKAEFRKRTRGFRYDPLVPKRQKPPTVSP
jgi:aminobenzoyl-glutamate utilization protein B